MHCKTSPGKTIIDIRMELVKCASDEIDEKLGLKRSVSSIVQKITTLETSYRSAADWMRQTGAGVQEEGGDFRTYLLKLCPYYDQLDQVFASKVNANPLYLNEVCADVVSLDKDLLSTDGDESSVTSKTTKRKVLVCYLCICSAQQIYSVTYLLVCASFLKSLQFPLFRLIK